MMSKPKFTKGPWMYRQNPGSTKEDWTFHIDRQGTLGQTNWGILIAACWGHVSESAEANARLIAAAPEMYEALKAIQEHGGAAAAELDAGIDAVLALVE